MRVVICGAAGKDFHCFNLLYRGREDRKVVAFTATQIPNIHGRVYPAALAGRGYPAGIPIHPEEELEELIRRFDVGEVVFAYSDVPHEHVMHLASRALAAGASFLLPSPVVTMLKANKPVISVCAVRTGSGKSQISRAVARILTRDGKRVAVVRHPMPYGDLEAQRVQHFATMDDLVKHECTVEEREEYEPHLAEGRPVWAGVDYADVLREAEREADVLLWEGGNNDTPFFYPDLEIVVADPHRPGHETGYHPGETNLRRAHLVVINKVDSAEGVSVRAVEENVARANPTARVVRARSQILVDHPELIRGRRVLVVEDGPTLTHGEMRYGAGVVAAQRYQASEIVDPRPWTVGSIAETYRRYPGIGVLLPAMGYGSEQIKDMEATLARADCDTVVIATPVDLGGLMRIDKPCVRVRYEMDPADEAVLGQILKQMMAGGGTK